jgi:serpin B
MKPRHAKPAVHAGARLALGLVAVAALMPAPSAASRSAPAPEVNAAFALGDLGQALLRQSKATNAVVSPVAVATALGLVQAGANGPAEHEIEALFGAGRAGAGALRHELPQLVRQVQGGEGSPLSMAAHMWVDQAAAASVPAAYSKRLLQRWQAEATRVSFAQSETARQQINTWTASHTGGKVAELLPSGSVHAGTQAVLTTAVHFKSPWERPFNPDKTEPRAFKTAGGDSKPVPTMVDERGVMQAQIDGHLVMELPFTKGYSLLLAVPAEGGAPTAGAAAGAAAGVVVPGGDQLTRWRSALKPLKCELALPRFAIAPQAGSLKTALQSLGVQTVFSDAADLRPMLGRGATKVHLEDLHHAAGITVDEAGGEAVAASAATVSSKSFAAPVPPCAVDRAFSFALLHQATGTPLFVGRIGDPTRVD